jgi:hypothetical protein
MEVWIKAEISLRISGGEEVGEYGEKYIYNMLLGPSD